MTSTEQKSSATAIVLLSGGIDSAACAYLLVNQQLRVKAVFFDYGQEARRQEQCAAQSIADSLNIPLTVIGVRGPSSFSTGELVGRNVFLATGALFLTSGECQILAMGLHAGTPYYDCSEQFAASTARTIADLTNGKTTFLAPFISWTKRDVYDYFLSTEIPVSSTYSCEAGTTPPCGKCASCLDRSSLGC